MKQLSIDISPWNDTPDPEPVNDWQLFKLKIDAQTEMLQAAPRAIRQMYAAFGRHETKTCGNCANLVGYDYHNKTYYKCKLAKMSHGTATDFRLKWQACGKFREKEKESE